MTPTLTAEQLAELERLEKEATPGPWEVPGYGGSLSYTAVSGPPLDYACGNCGFLSQGSQIPMSLVEDAAFISAARNSLPALIAMARELMELQAAVRWLEGDTDGSLYDGPGGVISVACGTMKKSKHHAPLMRALESERCGDE